MTLLMLLKQLPLSQLLGQCSALSLLLPTAAAATLHSWSACGGTCSGGSTAGHPDRTWAAAWAGDLRGLPSCPRAFSSAASVARRKVVFLGTPEVAAIVLRDLVAASQAEDAGFEVQAVVTKAPAHEQQVGEGASNQVYRAALALGLTPDQVLRPTSPKEPSFLARMSALAPDLCVTAAYGGMLPQAFLDIPRYGTVNIHPSLLPRYRGAAPVQRALELGEREVGVSLVYTELQCDAGPVLEQTLVPLLGEEQAPDLTARLFRLGSSMLLRRMADVLSGGGRAMAREQDHTLASYARKVSRSEAQLDLGLPAAVLHNRVRALAGWPGTYVELLLLDQQSGTSTPLQVPVLRTRVVAPDDVPPALRPKLSAPAATAAANSGPTPGLLGLTLPGPSAAAAAAASPHLQALQRVHYVGGRMLLPCGEGSLLEVLEVKARSVKPHALQGSATVSAKEFMRGLGRKSRLMVPLPGQAPVGPAA